jgi:murein DD-endopeptidase MepM/ murein hydrolase activator NlpD
LDKVLKITKVISASNRVIFNLFMLINLVNISIAIPISADILNPESKENPLATLKDSESNKSYKNQSLNEIDKISVPKTDKTLQALSKPFGEKTVIKKSFSKNPNNPHKGVLLTGGTPSVYPSYEGKIIAVDKLEGYETVIIVDHGDNIYSVYGNLFEVFVSEGDTISKGTLLGTTSKLSGLYYQVNQGSKSINPQSFFK